MKKLFAQQATEQRPDTRLIESKLRQYFRITGQTFSPESVTNRMYVAFDALAALAKHPAEYDEMLRQFQTLTGMTVICCDKGKSLISHPFETAETITGDEGNILAVEMEWSCFESMIVHKVLMHPSPDTEFIRRLHGVMMQAFQERMNDRLRRLAEKYNAGTHVIKASFDDCRKSEHKENEQNNL